MLRFASPLDLTKPSARAEKDVVEAFEKAFPPHWVVICNLPEISVNKYRISIKQTDALVFAESHIYFIEIKSHSRSIRVRKGEPFLYSDGLAVPDRTNAGQGFWKNHEEQAYLLKKILKEDYDLPSHVVRSKMVFDQADLEFGTSDLERNVNNTSNIIFEILREERTTRHEKLSAKAITRILRYFLDDERFEAPARPQKAGASAPPTERNHLYSAPAPMPVPAFPSGAKSPKGGGAWTRTAATSLPQFGEGAGYSPSPPPPPQVPPPPRPAPSRPPLRPASAPPYSPPPALPRSVSVAEPDPVQPGALLLWVIGVLFLLGVLSELVSCASNIFSPSAGPSSAESPARVRGYTRTEPYSPPYHANPSFPCTGDLLWQQRVICSDDSLAAQDREVAELSQRLSASADAEDLGRINDRWGEQWDRCGGSGSIPRCLGWVYREWLGALRDISAGADLESKPSVGQPPSERIVQEPALIGGTFDATRGLPPATRNENASPHGGDQVHSQRSTMGMDEAPAERSGNREEREGERAQRTRSRHGYAPPATGVICILPSGQEVRLSEDHCRNSSGVIYQ